MRRGQTGAETRDVESENETEEEDSCSHFHSDVDLDFSSVCPWKPFPLSQMSGSGNVVVSVLDAEVRGSASAANYERRSSSGGGATIQETLNAASVTT